MSIVIKGAGDLASGVALRLYRAGYQVIMTDIQAPSAVRRTVSFSEAVYTATCKVEDVEGARASLDNYKEFLKKRIIPVLVDVSQEEIDSLKPQAVIDAIIAKKNLGTYKNKDYYTVALGPGFSAPTDVDVVIETMRGHTLGRCIYNGKTIPNTGVPGEVGGYTLQRVLRSPHDGILSFSKEIGDTVQEKDKIGEIQTENGTQVIYATISGVIRGLLPNNYSVTKGFKIGDIDPRCELEHCYTVSDKGLALGGAALEALLKVNIYPEKKS